MTNWASYEAGTAAAWYLEAVGQKRCDTAWRAAACITPGGQARYSAVAIEVRSFSGWCFTSRCARPKSCPDRCGFPDEFRPTGSRACQG